MKYAVPFLHIIVPAFLIMMVIRLVGLYPQILSRDLIDRILTPVGYTVTTGLPIPETDWGHLQGAVIF